MGNSFDSQHWLDFMTEVCNRSIAENPEKEGDYTENGFLHCGVCREPKREFFDFEGHKILTSRDCKCIRDKKAEEHRKEEYRIKMERIEKLRSRSLMDDVFYKAVFKNFDVRPDNKKNYNACIKYCKCFQEMYDNNQGLLFYGPVGTGKSFAAACIANYLMSCLRPVMMTSFVKLLQQVSAFKDDEEDLLERLMEPDLLILDDLGAERNTDFALEKVYNIVDSRYRAQKPIILTTNLSLQEMKQTTDIRYARIYDRVFEMCYPMMFDGVSRRRVEAKTRFDKMKQFFEGD